MEIKEVTIQVPLTSTSTSIVFVSHVDEPHKNQEEQHINDLRLRINQ